MGICARRAFESAHRFRILDSLLSLSFVQVVVVVWFGPRFTGREIAIATLWPGAFSLGLGEGMHESCVAKSSFQPADVA
jgi:hypothetical protein